MKITKKISKNKNHYTGVNPCNFITVHQTGNTRVGANATNHANYINNGSSATWHYTVDSKQIIQHFEDITRCWHCGDGRGTGNMSSIGIEMCVNSDDDYIKAFDNLVWLIQTLMKRHNIPINKVVQHNKWTGKNCPMQIRQGLHGLTWSKLIERVKYLEQPSKSTTPSKTTQKAPSKATITRLAKEVIAGKHGNGEERKKSLGDRYELVQAEVNTILNK